MPVFLLANSPFCSLSSSTHGTGPSDLGAGVLIALMDFGRKMVNPEERLFFHVFGMEKVSRVHTAVLIHQVGQSCNF